MKLFKKIFDHEYKELERFKKIADQIMVLDEEMSKLSDTELKSKTEKPIFHTIVSLTGFHDQSAPPYSNGLRF